LTHTGPSTTWALLPERRTPLAGEFTFARLRKLKLPDDQMVGVEALARALEEPLRVIARNGGYEESPTAARAHKQKPGWGFNVLSGQFEDLWAAGVVDPLPVVQTAVDTGVSGALMALTTSVTVHRKKPPMETQP
jgi:chaperonin GroEL